MPTLLNIEIQRFSMSRIGSLRAPCLLTFVVGLWLQATVELAAQGHDKRFAKALITLRSKYDSVMLTFVDRPKSKYATVKCFRAKPMLVDVPLVDSSGSPSYDSLGNAITRIREEIRPCEDELLINTDGAVFQGQREDMYHTELNLTAPQLLLQYVYDSICDSAWNRKERNAPSYYDRRIIIGSNDFYRLFDVAKSSPIDSGYIKPIYQGQYLKIIRDGRVNFFDVRSGLLFKWDDPITYKLAFMYKSGHTVRLIARFDERDWQVLYPDGSKTSGLSYSFIDFISDNVSKSYSSESRINAGLVVGDDENKDIFIDLDMETGAPALAKGVIDFQYCTWWYCSNRRDCIDRIQFSTVENRFPNRSVSRALVMVELTDKSSKTVVYRKRHWIELNLGPREVGASNVITLDSQVWGYDIEWRVEILDYQ